VKGIFFIFLSGGVQQSTVFRHKMIRSEFAVYCGLWLLVIVITS